MPLFITVPPLSSSHFNLRLYPSTPFWFFSFVFQNPVVDPNHGNKDEKYIKQGKKAYTSLIWNYRFLLYIYHHFCTYYFTDLFFNSANEKMISIIHSVYKFLRLLTLYIIMILNYTLMFTYLRILSIYEVIITKIHKFSLISSLFLPLHLSYYVYSYFPSI